LVVWQRARALVKECYALSAAFPKSEMFGLTSQLRRAAVSVVCCIAEGHGRAYPREFLHFLSDAQASLREVDTLLVLSEDLVLGSTAHRVTAQTLADETGRMLTGLVRAERRKIARSANSQRPNG
jgi:four helix bundle protein